MGKKEFEEFINQSYTSTDSINNTEFILNRWYNNIDTLYTEIKLWLNDFIESGKVQIEENDLEIVEEAIGTYKVKSLQLSFAGNSVVVQPKGTIMIGTIGRVDLIGKSGIQKIILTDKNASSPKIHFFEKENEKGDINLEFKDSNEKEVEWVWKLTSEPPKITFTELNQETFLNCLMKVTNG